MFAVVRCGTPTLGACCSPTDKGASLEVLGSPRKREQCGNGVGQMRGQRPVVVAPAAPRSMVRTSSAGACLHHSCVWHPEVAPVVRVVDITSFHRPVATDRTGRHLILTCRRRRNLRQSDHPLLDIGSRRCSIAVATHHSTHINNEGTRLRFERLRAELSPATTAGSGHRNSELAEEYARCAGS